MVKPTVLPDIVKLRGGALCLEFSNTVKDMDSRDNKRYSIRSYEDFARWCEQTGIVSGEIANVLITRAKHDKAAASNAYAAALELRDLIYRIFKAGAESRNPDPPALNRFNDFHARAMSDARIERTEAGYRTTFAAQSGSIEWPLNAIARSAAGLLTGQDLDRVKLCSDTGCGRLFVDRSRNQSRRWCDMGHCGNRAKARRHYRRKKMKDEGIDSLAALKNEKPAKGGRDEMAAQRGQPEAIVRRAHPPKTQEVEIGSND